MNSDCSKDKEDNKELEENDLFKHIMEIPEYNYFAKDLNFKYLADGCNESTARYADVDSPKQL